MKPHVRVQRAFDKKHLNDIEVTMKLRWNASDPELNEHVWKGMLSFFRQTMSPAQYATFERELLEELARARGPE